MDPNCTVPLRSSPLRTRPVFPPAPAIPTSIAATTSHCRRADEASNELATSGNFVPDGHSNDAESVFYTASSSHSQQYSPIQDATRQVQFGLAGATSVRTARHPTDDILLKYVLCAFMQHLPSSFSKTHHPIPIISPMVLSRNISYTSLPNRHFISPDISDGGLATSTQRLAINSGHPTQRNQTLLFGHHAKPTDLPRLDSFLAKLKPSSFSPWTDVLRADEIAEYQRGNVRKFPLLHLIPKGLSLSDFKSNRLKREFIPGIENDCWRFVVDVAILTAGSPYGKDINMNVFRAYIRGMTLLFVRDNQSEIQEEVLNVTGGGSTALIVVFLISLLLIYKCRRLLERDLNDRQLAVIILERSI